MRITDGFSSSTLSFDVYSCMILVAGERWLTVIQHCEYIAVVGALDADGDNTQPVQCAQSVDRV